MDLRIADTFIESRGRLTGDEQNTVKTPAFDLQPNPPDPSMSLRKLDKAKDKNFWSVRVSGDLHLIVHKTPGRLLLCHVDNHDKADGRAGQRELETHPKRSVLHPVKIRELSTRLRSSSMRDGN